MNERLKKKKIKGFISGSGASLENDNKRRETLRGGIEKIRRMQHLMVFVQTSACCGFTVRGGRGVGGLVETTVGCTAAVVCCSGMATLVLNITTTFHPSPGEKNKTKHVLYVENLVLRGPGGILLFFFFICCFYRNLARSHKTFFIG